MFKKIFKYIILFILTSLITFFISIYISSLNNYKEADFNIPDDYFNTRHFDKDAESEENGFHEFIKILDSLENFDTNLLRYYQTKSECQFNAIENCDQQIITQYNNNIISELLDEQTSQIKDNITEKEIYEQSKQYIWNNNKREDSNFKKKIESYFYNKNKDIKISGEKNTMFLNEIINIENSQNSEEVIRNILNSYEEDNLRKLESFIWIHSIRLEKISGADFFKIPKKYTGIYGETIVYTKLLWYLNSSRLVIHNYMEAGKYNEGINIFINNQRFLDNIINYGDLDEQGSLFIIKLSKINLEYLQNITDMYILDKKLINKIITDLNTENNIGLINNSFKVAYNNNFIQCYKTIQKHCDTMYYGLTQFFENNFITGNENQKEKIKNKLYILKINTLLTLFYSNSEEKILIQKLYYDAIENNNSDNLILKSNLSNYMGRKHLPTNLQENFIKGEGKEEEIKILKDNILKKLKTD